MPTNDPDATIVQFGKHAGKRLDELDLDYRYRLWLDPQFERCHWHPEFAALNEAYEDAHPWTPSLGSEKIWFGRTSKGRELSTLYHRKGWLRWLLHPDRQRCFWYWRFKFLVAQYEEWLEHHARGYRPRRRSENVRDIGEQCAPWDDNVDAPGPDDAYECDDFVMRDDSDAESESECATPPPKVYDNLGEELAADVENLKDVSSSDGDDALSAVSQTSGVSGEQESNDSEESESENTEAPAVKRRRVAHRVESSPESSRASSPAM